MCDLSRSPIDLGSSNYTPSDIWGYNQDVKRSLCSHLFLTFSNGWGIQLTPGRAMVYNTYGRNRVSGELIGWQLSSYTFSKSHISLQLQSAVARYIQLWKVVWHIFNTSKCWASTFTSWAADRSHPCRKVCEPGEPFKPCCRAAFTPERWCCRNSWWLPPPHTTRGSQRLQVDTATPVALPREGQTGLPNGGVVYTLALDNLIDRT